MVDCFERKILRRIYGPMNDDGEWRIRYNTELYRLYQDSKLSNFIKLQRLSWAGHVQRMPESRIPKKILEGNPGGKRPVGKPRTRWGYKRCQPDTKNQELEKTCGGPFRLEDSGGGGQGST
jgi:hypothetical protein